MYYFAMTFLNFTSINFVIILTLDANNMAKGASAYFLNKIILFLYLFFH